MIIGAYDTVFSIFKLCAYIYIVGLIGYNIYLFIHLDIFQNNKYFLVILQIIANLVLLMYIYSCVRCFIINFIRMFTNIQEPLLKKTYEAEKKHLYDTIRLSEKRLQDQIDSLEVAYTFQEESLYRLKEDIKKSKSIKK